MPAQTNSITPNFWLKCERLLRLFPDHPEKFSGDAEVVEITRQFRTLVNEVASYLVPSEYWRGDASVGKGNWTNIPWIAIFDERESTSAQKGVYPVIHFRCDENPGIRLGLGVAATEFKSNPEAKATEVRSEFSPSDIAAVTDAGFTDVTATNAVREEIGGGKLSAGYARGMIFERFIPSDQLLADTENLDTALKTLLETYKHWVDHKQRAFALPTFEQLMRQYCEERVVFLSTNQLSPYFVSEFNDSGCQVQRADSGQNERVTFSSYQNKVDWLKEEGGVAERRKLDYTVAKEACFLQGPHFGISGDRKNVVLLTDGAAAAENLLEHIQGAVSPQLYKPVILLLVIEAVANGDLAGNQIRFDWLLPRFVDFFTQRNRRVSEQQLAEGFIRLSKDFFWLLGYHEPIDPLDMKSQPKVSQVRQRVTHAQIKEPYWTTLQNAKYRDVVLEAIGHKLNLPMNNDDEEIDETTPLNDRIENLVAAIAADGFTFEPWQISAYVTAVRTKPFVILAGVSGTGKSQLPQLVAKHTGGISQRVSVRPDWSDSSEVLGYVDLQGKFRSGVVLNAANRSTSNQNQHHTCIVDEMNLARVEYYFAEILSCIEDRQADPNGGYRSGNLLSLELPDDAVDEWGDTCIPPNLAITGTVNMDESTHGFSRKVLDRAFTIELSEVNLDWTPQAETTQEKATSTRWPVEAWHTPAIRLSDLVNLTNDEIKLIASTIEMLKVINNCLALSQLQVGYRTRDEVVLFVINANEVRSCFRTKGGDSVDPLDLAISMKILPRIVGGSNAIRQTLCGLLAICMTGSNQGNEEQAADYTSKWNSAGRPAFVPQANYPRSAARLCLMWDRLESEGFTSYWL